MYFLQILQLLNLKDGSDAKMFHVTAAACVKCLSAKSPLTAKTYLLDPLLEPLTRLTKGGSTCDQELADCLERLYLLFEVTSDPGVTFSDHLSPVILVLMALHSKLKVSHLKAPVGSLVEKYLKTASGMSRKIKL